jgi:hypothetical protein
MKTKTDTAAGDPGKNRESILMLRTRLITAAILGGSLILGAGAGALADPGRRPSHGPGGHVPYGYGAQESAGLLSGGSTAGASKFGYYGSEPGPWEPRPYFAGAAFFNGWRDEDRFDNGPTRARGCYTRCLLNHTEKQCQKRWLTICGPKRRGHRSGRH